METLHEKIIRLYPNLNIKSFTNGEIVLQNDSDGKGDYIKEWNCNEPLVKELKDFL